MKRSPSGTAPLSPTLGERDAGPAFGIAERKPRRTFFAVSRPERELFLPDGVYQPSGAREDRWFYTDEEPAGRWEELLRQWRPEAVVSGWTTPRIPDAFLREAYPRYVCHLGGSVRQVVSREFVASGRPVSNWGTLASGQVAEHALLLVLASLRNMGRWDWAFREKGGDWRRFWKGVRTQTLEERRVGIHGFGMVARRLVELLRPFRVEVQAYSAGVPEAMMRKEGVRPAPDLDALFSSSDIVVECEALTEASRGSVTEARLRMLPRGGVFVNVGRGAVVDEAALAAVAAEGSLRVACDVFCVEPPPPSSPLWNIPQALLSPHLAGPTHDRYPLCGVFALENLERFFAGESPEALVDLAAYDRST